MSKLAFSASFEYLCYGSAAIINILLFQCGDPHTERVNQNDKSSLTTHTSTSMLFLGAKVVSFSLARGGYSFSAPM